MGTSNRKGFETGDVHTLYNVDSSILGVAILRPRGRLTVVRSPEEAGDAATNATIRLAGIRGIQALVSPQIAYMGKSFLDPIAGKERSTERSRVVL